MAALRYGGLGHVNYVMTHYGQQGRMAASTSRHGTNVAFSTPGTFDRLNVVSESRALVEDGGRGAGLGGNLGYAFGLVHCSLRYRPVLATDLASYTIIVRATVPVWTSMQLAMLRLEATAA